VLTRASGEFMSKLHSREPVVLPEGSYDAWLDEKHADWKSVLDGAGEQPLREYAVSGFLNRRAPSPRAQERG
jgi:putative SOS response-associated peptidase YedK